jgi:hypothetical protein
MDKREYCLINVNGTKIKPRCKSIVSIDNREHDEGYRISKITLDLGNELTGGVTRGKIFNTYRFNRVALNFIWRAEFLNHNQGDNFFVGSMGVKLHLETIHVSVDNEIINDRVVGDVLINIINKLNRKTPPYVGDIKYLEYDLVMMLFPQKYHKIMERIVNVALKTVTSADMDYLDSKELTGTDIDYPIDVKKATGRVIMKPDSVNLRIQVE